MTPKYSLSTLVGALLICCGAAEQGRAATIYTYTGANFTSFGILDSTPLPAGTYTTSMNVTGSFTLQDPLLQNLSNANITADILSFSFFDGRNTITKADATAFTFFVNTDALANISAWGIFVRRDDPGFSIPTVGSQRRDILSNAFSDTAEMTECVELVSFGCLGHLDRGSSELAGIPRVPNPGSWSVSETPLPAALPLFAGGLGVIGVLARRRRKQKQFA
jgi:hypothetical protein